MRSNKIEVCHVMKNGEKRNGLNGYKADQADVSRAVLEIIRRIYSS